MTARSPEVPPDRQTALLQGIFHTAADAIVCCDHGGRIILFNPAAEEMFGYSREEALGQNVALLMPPPERELHSVYIERYREVGEFRIDPKGRELIAQRRDGSRFYIHIAISRVEHGEQVYFSSVIRDISGKKAVENALAKSEATYRTMFESAPEGLWLTDAEHRIQRANPHLCELIGYPPEELIGCKPQDFMDADGALHYTERTQAFAGRGRSFCDVALRHRDGRLVPCQISTVALRNRDGSVNAVLEFVADLTERVRAEQRLKEEQQFLQAVVDGVSDPILVIGTDYRLLLANRAARQINRQAAATCHQLSHGLDRPCSGDDHPCPLRIVMETGTPAKVVHQHQTWEGERSFELTASPFRDRTGALRGIIEVSRDITEHLEMVDTLKAQEEHLYGLAHHDTLTGLPNRLLFSDRLEQIIHRTQREDGRFALLFVDLDRFKQINDSLSHSFGDVLLRRVAERLRREMREEDTVARLGGDEFVILTPSLAHDEDVGLAAQRLLERLAEPFRVQGQEIYITSSIGICLYPCDGSDGETLLRNADAAMYRAKEKGRNTFQYYTTEITEQAYRRVFMSSGLRRALDSGEFELHYQPQVDLSSGQLVGAEALLRWRHPEIGLVAPDKFIALAEETGLVLPIGEWVLETACRQWAEWRRAGLELSRVAVNVSGKQLERGGLAEQVATVLKKTGCPPQALELEITEGSIMPDPQRACDVLVRLRDMGVIIAIDDFGTGYSSLSLLKRLPITTLKIDSSFVRDIPGDASDVAITGAIIAMADSLNLQSIAEGVETAKQERFLLEHGCMLGQGYRYGKPQPAEAFARRLEKSTAPG